jgi:hypothetical protein
MKRISYSTLVAGLLMQRPNLGGTPVDATDQLLLPNLPAPTREAVVAFSQEQAGTIATPTTKEVVLEAI